VAFEDLGEILAELPAVVIAYFYGETVSFLSETPAVVGRFELLQEHPGYRLRLNLVNCGEKTAWELQAVLRKPDQQELWRCEQFQVDAESLRQSGETNLTPQVITSDLVTLPSSSGPVNLALTLAYQDDQKRRFETQQLWQWNAARQTLRPEGQAQVRFFPRPKAHYRRPDRMNPEMGYLPIA